MPTSFHSTRSCDRSTGDSSGSSNRRRPGSCTAADSRRVKCPANRSIVAASNRSRLYSSTPDRPSSVSVNVQERSNFAVPVSTGIAVSTSPGSTSGPDGAFCNENSTCTSGGRLRSRSGDSSSTRRSNGTSWWA